MSNESAIRAAFEDALVKGLKGEPLTNKEGNLVSDPQSGEMILGAPEAIQGVLDRMGLNDDPENTRITPHTFRDTFASWLVQAGVSLRKVSKLLGHADVKMTEKYAHLHPDATGREAIGVLDRMAASKRTEGVDPKPTSESAASK